MERPAAGSFMEAESSGDAPWRAVSVFMGLAGRDLAVLHLDGYEVSDLCASCFVSRSDAGGGAVGADVTGALFLVVADGPGGTFVAAFGRNAAKYS